MVEPVALEVEQRTILAEADFGCFVDRVRRGEASAAELVLLLPTEHRVYAGRGANQIARMRGYLIASFEKLGLPENAIIYVLEILQNSQKPYLVAAAAMALRGRLALGDEVVPYLRSAIYNIQYRDEPLCFDHYAPNWPRNSYTTALAEILETLIQLLPSAPSAIDTLKSIRSSRVFAPEIRHRAANALQPLNGTVSQGEKSCCSTELFTDGSARSSAQCVNADTINDLIFEDQHGVKLSFADAFLGRPTIFGFFYTRCNNPNKCSLTVSMLGDLSKILEKNGVGDQINVAAITYDPGHDTPEKLHGYCTNRGFQFDNTTRAWRADSSRFSEVRNFFQLGASFVNSVVSRHEIEIYLMDNRGVITSEYTKLQWSVTDVASKAQSMLIDSKGHRKTNSGGPQ